MKTIHTLIFAVAVVGVISIITSASSNAAKPKQSLLYRLALPNDHLPGGCTIVELPPDFLPGKNLTNPSVITDLELIHALTGLFDNDLEGVIDFSAVKAMFFSVYEEKNGIGVNAWLLNSSDSAKKLYERLMQKYSEESRDKMFWLEGKHVVWLWRDSGTTDKCFYHFQNYVHQVVEPTELEKQKVSQPANSQDKMEQCWKSFQIALANDDYKKAWNLLSSKMQNRFKSTREFEKWLNKRPFVGKNVSEKWDHPDENLAQYFATSQPRGIADMNSLYFNIRKRWVKKPDTYSKMIGIVIFVKEGGEIRIDNIKEVKPLGNYFH